MLKTLVDKLRSKPPAPTVWWGRHSDIWGDPTATDFGWYCGWCGYNESGAVKGKDAQLSAKAHALSHAETVDVAPWK